MDATDDVAEGILISEGPDWFASKILFVNDAMCRMTGYSAAELIGQPSALLNGKHASRKTPKPVSVTALPNGSLQGTAFVAVYRDITKPKRLEPTFSEEARFQQMADQAPVMIWISGTDKLCRWCNKQWLQLTGRTMEQEIGYGWCTSVHPDDLPRFLDVYSTSFEKRQSFAYEYRLRDRTGQWRWMLAYGNPLYGEDGAFSGYIGSALDITERKQTEQTLVQYRRDLRIVASELMLGEERERQRLAENLHDRSGQALFQARMKLDQLSDLAPRAKELGTILEELGKLMNSVAFELSPAVLLKLGLRQAIRALPADLLQHHGLSVEIEDDNCDIALDERMAVVLFRSVRELLINTAKHAETNRVKVSLKRIEDVLQIEVEDRGKGFDAADQSHQLESGRLGLFSIRERLEYLGGSFNIQSARGEGTVATLKAPLPRSRKRG